MFKVFIFSQNVKKWGAAYLCVWLIYKPLGNIVLQKKAIVWQIVQIFLS